MTSVKPRLFKWFTFVTWMKSCLKGTLTTSTNVYLQNMFEKV